MSAPQSDGCPDPEDRHGIAGAGLDSEPRPMRIAIVSKANRSGGGASRVAEDLAGWYAARGMDVAHFCGGHEGPLLPFQREIHTSPLATRIYRQIHWMTRPWGLNELFPGEYFGSLARKLKGFDVVHFHDLLHTISPLTLALCARKKPVFFTVHDCTAFTGGCLYPMECERFRTGCGKCPSLASFGARHDFTRFNARVNRWVARNPRVHFIFPSEWIAEQAGAALQFGCPPSTIPYGIDPKPYGFPTRARAREELRLPSARRIVLVSAHDLSDPRKGAMEAVRAIESVRDLQPFILLVGKPDARIRQALQGFDLHETGFVGDRRELGRLFAAADLFLFCSLQDNLPLAVLETSAAGTPIVGFAAGGIPEIPGEEGGHRLLKTGDQFALNAELRKALIDPNLHVRSPYLKERIKTVFSPERCVEAHLALYREKLTMPETTGKNLHEK
jgi:glycosyltransferase involved in cell wall biosynthesis